MYIISYMQADAAQAAAHLTEATASAQAAALQTADGVTNVTMFGPVTPTEAENATDYRLSQASNYNLQDRLRISVLYRANATFGWANGQVLPDGEAKPDAISAAVARYAILNADQPQAWFPKIWANFLATLRPDRTTVAGVDAWVKENWAVFAMLWQDKLQLS